MSPTPSVARAVDLLRDVPGPGLDNWDWVRERAEQVGLLEQDLEGLTLSDALQLIVDMEQVWHMGSVLRAPSLRVASYAEGQLRGQLVTKMDLPILALRLPLEQLIEVLETHYRRRHRRWERIRDFQLRVDTPLGEVLLDVA